MTRVNIEMIGQGPPLILLHGWGWHSGIWQPLVPYLSEKYTLYLVDLPGFGKSSPITSDYSFIAFYQAISSKLPERAIWLGWSLGGMLAWWTAIHHPERVTKLVTIASSPKFVRDSHWPGVANETLEKFYLSLAKDFHRTLEDFLALQLRGGAHHQQLFIQLQPQLNEMPKAAIPALKGGLNLLQESDLRSELSKISCPSLHIFGQHDTLIPANVVPLIAELMPHGQCEIIHRAGHIPFLTQTGIFLDLLNKFL